MENIPYAIDDLCLMIYFKTKIQIFETIGACIGGIGLKIENHKNKKNGVKQPWNIQD